MLIALTAGLLLGLAGSLHCVGMCGPLSLGLPVHGQIPFRKSISLLAYHGGRIFTYAMLGLVFGLAGRQFYLAGLQQGMSIVLGIVMIVISIQYFWFRRTFQPAVVKKFHNRIQTGMIRLMKHSSIGNLALFGALNGLLPCGMVYVAIAGAMSTNNVTDGVVFMAGFGFATLPAMFALGFFGYLLGVPVRNQLKKLSPYVMALIGVLLILRGLNLGIPFVSPIMEEVRGEGVICR